MRIVIAPDKFKGSLTAEQAARAIARGIRSRYPDADIDLCPMADGGEGTVAAMLAATGGKFITQKVTGPLPEMKIDARFGILGDGQTAVIEMAAASGLALIPPEDRNPMNTTTFGAGELLRAAAEMGLKKIILGIGGSATCDAGIGAAQGAGLTVLLRDGSPVSSTEPLCGRDIDDVLMVKHARGSPVDGADITVACDVTNPLYGPQGAAVVYGPQKGASPQEVRELDAILQRWATRTGKQAEAHLPGAGAAGGLGFGMMVYFGARLQKGAEMVIDAVKLRQRLQGADLCFTGEGKIDRSTLAGKAAGEVGRVCAEMEVPCLAIAGLVDRVPEMDELFDRVIQIKQDGMDERFSMEHADELLQKACKALW